MSAECLLSVLGVRDSDAPESLPAIFQLLAEMRDTQMAQTCGRARWSFRAHGSHLWKIRDLHEEVRRTGGLNSTRRSAEVAGDERSRTSRSRFSSPCVHNYLMNSRRIKCTCCHGGRSLNGHVSPCR